MTLRRLRPDERDRVKPVYEAENGHLPDEGDAVFYVAEDERGDIIGLWALELMLHAGPLWVDPRYRGYGLYRKLFDLMVKDLPKVPGSGFYVFSGSDRTSHILQNLGLTDLAWRVYKKEF